MGVISDEAFEAAVIQVIHPEIAKFSVGPHLFDVIPGRFILQTESEPFAQLLDMAVQIFCDCLPHTPINMMGINLDSHFNTRSQAQRTAFGRAFAPLAPWGDFGKRIEAQPANDPGGVIILTMREGNLPDRPHGYRQVTLEASRKLDQNTGVRVLLNDHYETRTESNIAGAEEIMTILKDRFDASLAESKAIVDAVMEHSKGLPA